LEETVVASFLGNGIGALNWSALAFEAERQMATFPAQALLNATSAYALLQYATRIHFAHSLHFEFTNSTHGRLANTIL